MTDWSQEAIEQRVQDKVDNRLRKNHEGPAQVGKTREPAAVVVTDIYMSFGSMVAFMVKWAIASIPALLILFVLSLLCWTLGIFFLRVVGK
jgi:hypothetical protein